MTCNNCQGRGWVALEDTLLRLGYLGEIMPCPTCQPGWFNKWAAWRKEVPALMPEGTIFADNEYPPGRWDLDDVAVALEEAVEARFKGERLTGSMLAGFLAWRIKRGFQMERHNQRLHAPMPQDPKGIKEAEHPKPVSRSRFSRKPQIP